MVTDLVLDFFSMKIRTLLGTYLIRQRANGQFALLLKVFNVFNSQGVKSMKIQEESEDGKKVYYLSVNRKFTSLARLVSYYKRKDLTENFNDESLSGVTLQTPFKDLRFENLTPALFKDCSPIFENIEE